MVDFCPQIVSEKRANWSWRIFGNKMFMRRCKECLRDTNGRGPITTRWIDTNKGDPTNPNFRSRLVVREIKARKRPEERIPQNMLFSSTPPLEAIRLLCSLWATERSLKIGLWDISRAHFYGVPKRRINIELPQEDSTPGMVGRLLSKVRNPGPNYGSSITHSCWSKRDTSGESRMVQYSTI